MGYAICLVTSENRVITLKPPLRPPGGRTLYRLLGLMPGGCQANAEDLAGPNYFWFAQWNAAFEGSLCDAINELLACTWFEPVGNTEIDGTKWIARDRLMDLVRKLLKSKPKLGNHGDPASANHEEGRTLLNLLDDSDIVADLQALLIALQIETRVDEQVHLLVE